MNMNELGPEQVQAALDGDPSAVRTVVQTLQRPVFHLALRMLMHHDDAEEATQEALLKVVTRLSSFDGRSLFSTWAWSVATRSIIDFSRARSRPHALTFEDFAKDVTRDLDQTATTRPEDAVLVGQVKVGCARAMLQCLDEDQRLAYVLGEILEVDQVQAAQALGLTAATFRKRLERARLRVATAVRAFCGVVSAQAQCRCRKRLVPAQAMRRLDRRDTSDLDVFELHQRIEQLDADSASRMFFRADPQTSVAERVLPQVYAALGLRD